MGADTKKAELDVLTGETFDKSYVKSQVKGHRDTVDLLQKEISSGQDAQAKAFAQKVLPTVQSHLKAIEGIATGMGSASNAYRDAHARVRGVLLSLTLPRGP